RLHAHRLESGGIEQHGSLTLAMEPWGVIRFFRLSALTSLLAECSRGERWAVAQDASAHPDPQDLSQIAPTLDEADKLCEYLDFTAGLDRARHFRMRIGGTPSWNDIANEHRALRQ